SQQAGWNAVRAAPRMDASGWRTPACIHREEITMRMPSMSGAAVVAATLASGILFATTASAEALDYAFDRVHTQVHASVTHMGMSNSTARFHVKDGTIR